MKSRDIHLYTIWNAKHCPTTIDEHIKVLHRNKRLVKWLVLYDEDSQKAYEETLSEDDLLRVNDQARRTETLMFIQPLNIFSSRLFVGKVEGISKEVSLAEVEKDPLVPKYYAEALKKNDVRACYQITLSELKVLEFKELLNLIPDSDFKSEKFNYPFPCKVYQREQRPLFPDDLRSTFKSVEIRYGEIQNQTRSTFYVSIPLSNNTEEALTIDPTEMVLIRVIKDSKRKLAAGAISEPLASECRKRGVRSNKLSDASIRAKISRLNGKFVKHYGKPLIIRPQKVYELNVKHLRIIPAKSK